MWGYHLTLDQISTHTFPFPLPHSPGVVWGGDVGATKTKGKQDRTKQYTTQQQEQAQGQRKTTARSFFCPKWGSFPFRCQSQVKDSAKRGHHIQGSIFPRVNINYIKWGVAFFF